MQHKNFIHIQIKYASGCGLINATNGSKKNFILI